MTPVALSSEIPKAETVQDLEPEKACLVVMHDSKRDELLTVDLREGSVVSLENNLESAVAASPYPGPVE